MQEIVPKDTKTQFNTLPDYPDIFCTARS